MGTGGAVGVPKSDEKGGAGAQRRWLIARVQPNTEKKSCERLTALNYEAFVATQEETGYWKNGTRKKKKKIQRVVITQFVFVHVTQQEQREIVALPFIKGYLLNRAVSSTWAYAELSNAEVERLKLLLRQATYPVEFISSGFKIGEEVQVELGSFTYPASVVRIVGDANPRIGIQLQTLGCAYIEVAPHQIVKK